MFNTFPREIAFPQRKLVHTLKEYLEYVNLYNGKRNLHTTVYAYRNIAGRRPVYDSAIINWVYFDFDGDNSYKGAKKFTKFLLDDKINFAVNLSGGGFHFYLGAKHKDVPNIKLSLKTMQEEILNTYNILKYNDPHTVGNVAQETRIPNTFNVQRGRYCIALKPEEVLELSLEEIQKLATEQRPFNVWWNRGKKLELPIVEANTSKENKSLSEIEIDALEPCVEAIQHKKNPTHDERFFLALYLSDEFRKGIDINRINITELAEKIITYMKNLNWSDFCDDPNKNKSTRYQVFNILNKRLNYVPSCEWRKARNICPGKCFISLI